MPDDPFVSYYEQKSVESNVIRHFQRLRDLLLKVYGGGGAGDPISVADIGCGAGTFSRIWAESGCIVSALDVNASLVKIARERTAAEAINVDFVTGSADSLPWPDAAFDIVVMPELLEHVVNWRQCLSEASRVARPGGIVHVSTTNRLCPSQEEFTLLMYSWYPGWLKKRCLRLATTSRREWVNYATYPAVNWFDPYCLGSAFRELGMLPMDRFDLFAGYSEEHWKRRVGKVATSAAPLRWFGHVLTPGTTLVGRKL